MTIFKNWNIRGNYYNAPELLKLRGGGYPWIIVDILSVFFAMCHFRFVSYAEASGKRVRV